MYQAQGKKVFEEGEVIMIITNVTDEKFSFYVLDRLCGRPVHTYTLIGPGESICADTNPEEAARLERLNHERVGDVMNLLPEEYE